MRKIISLSGEMQVGKDEFAKPLIEAGFVKGSFAKNLKAMCGEIFDLTEFDLEDQKGKARQLNAVREFNPENFHKIIEWMKKSHDVAEMATSLIELRDKYLTNQLKAHGSYRIFNTPREVLQFVGTDICRAAIHNYHVEVLLRELQANPNTNYIVCDSRFPNERSVLKDEFGAILIRIKRPEKTPEHLINAEIPVSTPNSGHASENSLGEDKEYDEVIINNGSIEDLHDIAKKYIV